MKKIFKAANNSSRIPDLPTGYVNNINLIANELWTNYKDYEMFLYCYWGNQIFCEERGIYLINT